MDEKSGGHFENKPAESEQLSRINQQLQAANQQLRAAHQQLKAEEQQLRAASQQLRAANQQLKVEEQQLRAANQQLFSANQQLKKTEKELRTSKQLFEMLFNGTINAIAVYDAKGDGKDFIFKKFNPAAEKIDNIREEELLGKSVLDVFPGVKEFGLFDVFKRVWRTGQAEHHPVSLYKDKRISGWRENYVFKLPTGEIVAIYEDITERKQAEQAIRESEEKFKGIFEHANDCIIYLNRSGRVLDINERATQIFGGPKNQVLNSHFADLDIFSSKDKPMLMSNFEGVFSGREPIVTIPIKNKKGQNFLLECSASLTKTTDKSANIMVIARDITERKKAEEVLREQKEILQTILDNIPVMIAFLDSNCNHKWVNQAWQKILGWSLEEAQSRDVLKELYPDPQYYQYVVDFISKAESNWGDFRTRRRDRTVLETTWTNVPLSDGSNIGIGLDITERKRAEQAIQDAHDKLEKRVEERTAQLLEANRQLQKETAERMRKEEMLRESERLAAVGSLAAKIAHEINNPLAGIKNSFLLIKDSIPDNHPYYKYVGLIEKEIERVSDIVSQMYDLYRPVVQVQKRRFSLHEAVADVVALLKAAGEEHKVDVNIDIDQNIIVRLSDSLLRQVLFNVIQNAIEASHPDSKVRVTGEICEGILDMRIIDTGVGISKDIRNRIFEPFFTSKRDSTKRSLGLGLSVCKNIVNAIGGEVTVQSRAGKGTTFAIKIPLEGNNAKPDNG